MAEFDVSVKVEVKQEIRTDIVNGKVYRSKVPTICFKIDEAYEIEGETRVSTENLTMSFAKFLVFKKVISDYEAELVNELEDLKESDDQECDPYTDVP